MGKFDGMMICSDIDGTLIDDDFNIPKANLDAISYFKSLGGRFTLATGRTPQGIKLYIDKARPNAPVVCQNGAGIYDFTEKSYLWNSVLGQEAPEVLEYVFKKYPTCGVEVISADAIYFIKENEQTRLHIENENLEVIKKPYYKIKEPWIKILLAQSPDKVDIVQRDLENSRFSKIFRMVRSYSTYFEILDKNVDKGRAVLKLSQLLNIEKNNLIVVGDNDNDAEMLSTTERSYAVKNASKYAKKSAKHVLDTDNNNGALARIIEILDKEA